MVMLEGSECARNLRVSKMSRAVEDRYLAGQRLPDAKVFAAPSHLVAKVEQA